MVAAGALPDDRLERDVVEEVDLPERLARRRVGQVDLDERPLDGEQGVAQRHARVGQAAGVDDRDVEVAPVEPVDQGALVVRLEEVDVEAELGGPRRDPGVDLVERLAAVDLGLARPDQVEVRAPRGPGPWSSRAPGAGRQQAGGGAFHDVRPRCRPGRRRRRRSAGPSAGGRPACFLSVARWASTVSSG